LATVVYQQPFNPAGIQLLLKGIGMIKDQVISSRYKDEVAKRLKGYKEEKEVPYTMEMPTDFIPTGGEKEYAISGQYREPSMQPIGSRQVQTTVPIPLSPEEKIREQYKVLRGIKSAGAGLPSGIRPMDTSNLFPKNLDRFELRQLEEEQKIRARYRGQKVSSNRIQYIKSLQQFYKDNRFIDEEKANQALSIWKLLLKNKGELSNDELKTIRTILPEEDSYMGIHF